MYKLFMNKHDLINESQDELQDESLEKILADESQDERIDESREEIQADDLDENTETFLMSVRQESRADE